MKKLTLIILLLLSGFALANPPGTFQPLLLASSNNIPVGIGKGAVNGNSANVTMTTTSTVATGDLIVVTIFTASGSPAKTITSVSDGINTYVQAANISGAVNYNTSIWYVQNAVTVPSGTTITATFSASTTGGNGSAIIAAKVSGIVTSSSLDKTATDNQSTASPSVTSATLSQASEIAFGAISSDNGSATLTQSPNFTTIDTQTFTGYPPFGLSYSVVNSTAAVTYAPTYTLSGRTGIVLATFKKL